MNDKDTKTPTPPVTSANEQEPVKTETKSVQTNEVVAISESTQVEALEEVKSIKFEKPTTPEIPSPSKSKKDPNMCGVLTLSIGIAFVFFGFNTAQSFATPLLGNLGSYSMAIVYLVNALCNFIVPSVIDAFPTEKLAMSVHGIEYGIYIATFIYLIPMLSVIWSALHGYTSSVLCAVQGIALQSYSTEKDRGKKSGLFFSFYMLGSTPSSLYALGNITAFCLLNVMDSSTNTNTTGWLGPSSWLFVILSLSCFIGDFILFFLPKPVRVDASQHIKQKSTKRMSVWSRVKYIWHIMTNSNIKYLLFVFINVGYGAVTISGQITRHIRETQYVGIFMCIYSITDVIWSNVCGFLSDKYGSTLIIVLSVIAELIALVLSFVGNYLENYFVMYAAAVCFSLQDAAIQTESLTLVGRYFYKEIDEANCIFRMFQCLGGGICFIISPLFVTAEDPIPSIPMFTVELVIAAVVSILSYVFYAIFDHKVRHVQVPSKI